MVAITRKTEVVDVVADMAVDVVGKEVVAISHKPITMSAFGRIRV